MSRIICVIVACCLLSPYLIAQQHKKSEDQLYLQYGKDLREVHIATIDLLQKMVEIAIRQKRYTEAIQLSEEGLIHGIYKLQKH